MTSKTIYRAISDRTLANFKPTRLYIKRHTITGMMYFGKSTAVGDSIYRYTGSGIDWGLHLKEFGKEYVETIWVSNIYSKDMIYELREFALGYSREHNIAESPVWANRVPESGLGGGGRAGVKHTKEHRANIVAARAANRAKAVLLDIPYGTLGKKHTKEHTDKVAVSNTGKKHTKECNARQSDRLTGVKWTDEQNAKAAKTRTDNKLKGISHGNTGKVRSTDQKVAQSARQLGKKKSPEAIAAMRGKKRGPYKKKVSN